MKEYGTISSPYYNEIALQEVLQHNKRMMEEWAILALFLLNPDLYIKWLHGA